jgi:hypothetical protein
MDMISRPSMIGMHLYGGLFSLSHFKACSVDLGIPRAAARSRMVRLDEEVPIGLPRGYPSGFHFLGRPEFRLSGLERNCRMLGSSKLATAPGPYISNGLDTHLEFQSHTREHSTGKLPIDSLMTLFLTTLLQQFGHNLMALITG